MRRTGKLNFTYHGKCRLPLVVYPGTGVDEAGVHEEDLIYPGSLMYPAPLSTQQPPCRGAGWVQQVRLHNKVPPPPNWCQSLRLPAGFEFPWHGLFVSVSVPVYLSLCLCVFSVLNLSLPPSLPPSSSPFLTPSLSLFPSPSLSLLLSLLLSLFSPSLSRTRAAACGSGG